MGTQKFEGTTKMIKKSSGHNKSKMSPSYKLATYTAIFYATVEFRKYPLSATLDRGYSAIYDNFVIGVTGDKCDYYACKAHFAQQLLRFIEMLGKGQELPDMKDYVQ